MTVKVAPSIQTKFGNASVDKNGYYIIHSNEKENKGKKLHRLIFEDFYNINLNKEFPEGVVIHHNDGNKLNNEIWNLIPMSNSEHSSIHSFPHTDETKKHLSEIKKGKKIGRNSKQTLINKSKAVNPTGYFRVTIIPKLGTKQGFLWLYEFYDGDEEKYKRITSVSLKKLKEKVLAKGLDWLIVDENKAIKTCNKHNYDPTELM